MKSTPQFNKRPSFYTPRGVEAEFRRDVRQQTVCRDVMIFFFATGDAFMTSYINQPRSLRRTARLREVWRESQDDERMRWRTRGSHTLPVRTPPPGEHTSCCKNDEEERHMTRHKSVG